MYLVKYYVLLCSTYPTTTVWTITYWSIRSNNKVSTSISLQTSNPKLEIQNLHFVFCLLFFALFLVGWWKVLDYFTVPRAAFEVWVKYNIYRSKAAAEASSYPRAFRVHHIKSYVHWSTWNPSQASSTLLPCLISRTFPPLLKSKPLLSSLPWNQSSGLAWSCLHLLDWPLWIKRLWILPNQSLLPHN